MKRAWSILFCGACAFGGSFLAAGAFQHPGSAVAQSAKAPPPPPPASLSAQQLGERFESVIRQVSPGVVAVEAVKPPKGDAPGKSAKPVEESGSGVLVRWEGVRGTLVITNNHVVGGAKPE